MKNGLKMQTQKEIFHSTFGFSTKFSEAGFFTKFSEAMSPTKAAIRHFKIVVKEQEY